MIIAMADNGYCYFCLFVFTPLPSAGLYLLLFYLWLWTPGPTWCPDTPLCSVFLLQLVVPIAELTGSPSVQKYHRLHFKRNPIRWFPDLLLTPTFIHSYTHTHSLWDLQTDRLHVIKRNSSHVLLTPLNLRHRSQNIGGAS